MSLWSHRTPAVAGLLSCFACCYSPFKGSQRLGRGFHSKKLQSRCELAAHWPPRGGRPPDCNRIPSRRQASGEGHPSDKIERRFFNTGRDRPGAARSARRTARHTGPVSTVTAEGWRRSAPDGAARPIQRQWGSCSPLDQPLTTRSRALGTRAPGPNGAPPRATLAPGAQAGRPSRGSRPRPGRSRATRPQRKVPQGRRASGANPRPRPPVHATRFPSSPCHPPVRSNRFLSATFEHPPRLPPGRRACL